MAIQDKISSVKRGRLGRRDEEDRRYEIVEEQHGYELRDDSQFDRIAFAMRALDILKPSRMRVVVYERTTDFSIERGREPSRPGQRWAMVGIPPHASRERIAWGLAELAGVDHVPFMVDVILEKARSA